MNATFELTGGKEIKMTYGLLNILCRVVGDIDGTAMVGIDNDLRDAVVLELLTTRDSKGKPVEDFNFFEIESSPEEIERLIDWAQGHVIDFFMKSAVATAERMFPIKKKMEDLTVSLSGTVA